VKIGRGHARAVNHSSLRGCVVVRKGGRGGAGGGEGVEAQAIRP
jgi:hypothetical protein